MSASMVQAPAHPAVVTTSPAHQPPRRPSPSAPHQLPAPKQHETPTPAQQPSVHPPRRLHKALSRTAYKLHLLHRLNERHRQSYKADATTTPKQRAGIVKRANKFNARLVVTIAAVSLILVTTGYISFDTWQTNNLTKQALAKNAASNESSATLSADRQSSEGKDESPLPNNALASYTVASSLPRALYIDSLGVSARILPMGVNPDGSMQAPLGIYDAGWYSGSVRPGETGAMVLNGHSSGPTREGLLGRLDTLKTGDELTLEKGDKTRLRYKVIHVETVALESVDMNKMMLPYGTAKRGLNIYTCTGKWLPAKQTFDHRAIVYAAEV